jgi:aspartyl-tRNA(Asn)/glutamyl-tRNA(Gln) amidotransferase subunit A
VAATEHVRHVIDEIPWRRGIGALTKAYGDGSLSPIEVLQSCLNRIEKINPAINAIVTVDGAGALEAAQASARRWQSGAQHGPLDGVPITVKDSIPVKGMRATWGSGVYRGYVPEADELPVARVRAAGAIIVGKTNVPEFTLQGYTDNALFGPTRNPWDLRLTPGGSSGGAVASVAAGLVPLAIGTDGGGSIRRPASHTGLVGHKPTVGRVARADGFPVILHDFEVIGPIARTIADAATLLAIIAGPDLRDRASLAFGAFEPDLAADPAPQRILFVPRFGDSPVDPEITASVRQAAQNLEALGHEIEEGEAPFDVDALNRTWPVISQAGLAWLLHGVGGARDRAGKAFQEMAATGAQLSAMDYVDALNAVRHLYAATGETFARHDFVLTPSAAALPWPAPETHPPTIENRPVGPRGHAVFTAFANASGCPGINIPCTPSRGGLPIGFQLVGPFGADEKLLQIAAQYERAHPWAHRWPALAEGRTGFATA